MSDKLSDCPFCGRPDARVRDFEESAINVSCKCGVQMFGGRAHFGSREEAIAAWNRRASPAPAILMPPLNDAMRAVLTNENCIYGTPDELYAALVKAAPAISESELTEAMIDAARPFFLGRECGCKTIEGMRKHFELSGIDMSALPAWFREGAGHLTKSGQAVIVWHLMVAARKGEKS